ncbi:MAG: M24 family metallopeptidase [Clostridiales bacterium]|nr:M24 family metallopeptidase [Clostridiales bacterium]OPZ69036.1 MAG: putative peptidase [Firmicutes bacterium ADurb.Bin467]
MKQYVEDKSIRGRFAEIEVKVENLRRDMERNGWDAIYVSKSEHFAWITAGGDNIVTRFVEGGVCAILITRTGRYFLCNNIETLRMIVEEKLPELGFEERSWFWYENRTMKVIHDLIGGGRLAADIPLAGAADANPVLLDREKVLCDNEIARYLHLGRTFSEVIERFAATIRPGDTEIAIAGGLGKEMWAAGLEPVLFLIATDHRIYDYRHPIATDKKLEKYLMISCNCRYKGLVTKITRMAYFGDLPDELREQYGKTIEIENIMAGATKPGVDDLEIFELSKKLYADAGYPEMWRVHHQGGPQSYTNGFYLMTQDRHEVVRLNQCYGYNPSITGTKTEDGFIVTEDGPLFITFPVTFPALKSTINGVEYVRPGILEIK